MSYSFYISNPTFQQASFATQLSIPKEHENVLCGISLSTAPGKACYIPLISSYSEDHVSFIESQEILKENKLLQKLREEIFENPNVKKVAYDVKQHIKALAPYNVTSTSFLFNSN